MSQVDNQVKELVLGYFHKIHAEISEKNGLYDVIIPNNYLKLFKSSKIKFIFDNQIAKPDDYELMSPGSNTLFTILNECIKLGPILSVKLDSTESTIHPKLRFYFYLIFESLKSKSEIIHIDVDIDSKKITPIDDSKINFKDHPNIKDLSNDDLFDCYIIASDQVEKNMKNKIKDFTSDMLKLKNEESDQIESKYTKLRKKLEEESIELQSKSDSGIAFQKIVDLHQILKQEETQIRKILDKKYEIRIDFALISGLIIL